MTDAQTKAIEVARQGHYIKGVALMVADGHSMREAWEWLKVQVPKPAPQQRPQAKPEPEWETIWMCSPSGPIPTRSRVR